MLGTCPRPLIADFDGNLEPLEGREDVFIEEFYDPLDWRDCAKTDLPSTAWQRFKNFLKLFRAEKPEGVETFATDSLTFAAEAALRWVAIKNGHQKTAISLPDWGEAITEVKDMLAYVSTLHCNAVLTAHYQILSGDDETGKRVMTYVPLTYGKDLPFQTPTYWADVWRTCIQQTNDGKVHYRLQLRPEPPFTKLKTTFKKVNEMYVEPNFTKLLQQEGLLSA